MDYNARFYDVKVGRFISADTIVPNPANPQSLNRYSYVYNNPLKYNDPSGHDPSPARKRYNQYRGRRRWRGIVLKVYLNGNWAQSGPDLDTSLDEFQDAFDYGITQVNARTDVVATTALAQGMVSHLWGNLEQAPPVAALYLELQFLSLTPEFWAGVAADNRFHVMRGKMAWAAAAPGPLTNGPYWETAKTRGEYTLNEGRQAISDKWPKYVSAQ